MTDRSPISRLGVYMRTAGKALSESIPLDAASVRGLMVGSIDVPYAQATLMRLAERGIAREVEGGFIRGDRWLEAADYYGWQK